MNSNPFFAQYLAYPYMLIADKGQVLASNLAEYDLTSILEVQNADSLTSLENWQNGFNEPFKQTLLPLWQRLITEPTKLQLDGDVAIGHGVISFILRRLASKSASLLVFKLNHHHLRSLQQTATLNNSDLLAKQQGLEGKITSVQLDLTRSIHTLEALQEELRTTSEELMASNEELVASNEELHVMNEELVRLNNLHAKKFEELVSVHQYYHQALAAYDMPILILDESLNINRFTTAVKSLFALEENDIGRPLADINCYLEVANFVELVKQSTIDGQSIVELVDKKQHSWLVTLNKNNIQPGWILTFVETTHLEQKRTLQGLLDALPQHIAILSNKGTILYTNRAWRRFALANGIKDLSYTGVGDDYLHACRVSDDYPDPSARRCYWQLKSLLNDKLDNFSLIYPCHSPFEHRWFNLQVIRVSGLSKIKAIVSHHNLSASLTELRE
ncbi:hypothetical protein THIAE_07460 [Thiomicrospira aerophila AL3]|uniref:PAS domain-containing protein n=1 Tax=Thiomicrospira aerophila AL3 TaxID=717772 RepID=W0DUR1_9GAMM|nr:PAS domain-containing protein [Thiomicrospira aerophila]AHF02335.1 hypothetical protein THIAE_07460 [Thiomicrospira aerophila AL3]